MGARTGLNVPIQGAPVDRLLVVQPYLVDYGVFKAASIASPQPSRSGAFESSGLAHHLAVCSVLNPKAFARCFALSSVDP